MGDAALSLAATLTAPTPTSALAAGPIAELEATAADGGVDPFAQMLAAVTKAVDVIALPAPAVVAAPTGPVTDVAPELTLPSDDGESAPQGDAGASTDQDGDPLSNAIAAGLTAILALAQIPPPPPAPTTPATNDAAVAATPAKVTLAANHPRPLPLVLSTTRHLFEAAQAQLAAASPSSDQPAADPLPGQLAAVTALPIVDDTAPAAQIEPDTGEALASPPVQGSPAPAASTPIPAEIRAHVAAAVAALRQTVTPIQPVIVAASTQPVIQAAAAVEQTDAVEPARSPEVEPAASNDATTTLPARNPQDRLPHTAPTTRPAEPAAPEPVRAQKVAARHGAENGMPVIGLNPDRAAPTQVAGDGMGVTSSATSGPDGIVQQQLSIARDGQWLDSLARDIAQSAGSGRDLHFKLNPQHLGALTVAIAQSADGAAIRMTAETDTARSILIDAQPRLVAEARAQGLRISEAHVDLNQSNSGSGSNPGTNANTNANTNGGSGSAPRQGDTAGQQASQNRQSSPGHQPFLRNRPATDDRGAESVDDSGALFA